jgi:hypothetical protein
LNGPLKTTTSPAVPVLHIRSVAFRIIWRNVSELFGVVSALRRNASQTVAATNMAAIHKQNQMFAPIVGATLGSRGATLVLPRRSSGLSGAPNSSQTLRHIAIKATLLAVTSMMALSKSIPGTGSLNTIDVTSRRFILRPHGHSRAVQVSLYIRISRANGFRAPLMSCSAHSCQSVAPTPEGLAENEAEQKGI